MKIEDCFKIGYVAKTHGLNGEVTINTLPECPDLSSTKSIFIDQNGSLVPYFIKSISIKGDKAFVKFDEVNNIDAAAELKGHSLYLAKSTRPKLSRGEFYNDELVGFEVIENDEPLGNVTDIMEAGPNRFLVLDHNGKEVLIPINGPFIKSVNKTKKKVTVELPDGFLEL
ncbi:MAG TPA: ribosome maturation factor RimM [Cyclobacteriaceae bacterium]|nr:ribosome maturation factor RimM [Cyclobacteriaceae bacterium]